MPQRWMASARNDAAGSEPAAAVDSGSFHAAAHVRHLHDAGPIRRTGRWRLLQRRVAAARHVASRWRLVTATADGTDSRTDTCAASGRVHEPRSLRGYRRRHLL